MLKISTLIWLLIKFYKILSKVLEIRFEFLENTIKFWEIFKLPKTFFLSFSYFKTFLL